jgi:hypothetical protein
MVFDPGRHWIELSQRALMSSPLRERDRIALDIGFGAPRFDVFLSSKRRAAIG